MPHSAFTLRKGAPDGRVGRFRPDDALLAPARWRAPGRVGSRPALALVPALIFILAAPGATGAPPAFAKERPRVVFINPGITGEVFWSLVSDTMQAAADQLDIDLTVHYAERNRVMMRELGLAAVAAVPKPDALILVNEEQAGLDLLEASNAQGIPTLMLLNDIVGKDRQIAGEPGGRLSHWLGALVPDNFSAGNRMAEALIRFAQEKGRLREDGSIPIIALYGDTVTPASIDRNGGLKSVAATNPLLRLEHELTADWDREKARLLTMRALDRAVRLNRRPPVGIWAANDPIALGAVEALRAHGLVPGRDVGVVGLNWSPDALKSIRDTCMLMSDGGHFFGGAWAMVVLRDHFDRAGAAPTRPAASAGPTIRFAMSPVDASNIDSFSRSIGPIIIARDFKRVDFTGFTIGPNGNSADYDFSLPALIRAVGAQ